MQLLRMSVVALGLLSGMGTPAMSGSVLITEAEAARPSPGDAMMATRGLTRGPAVEQVEPSPDSKVKAPFPLKINFSGRNNVAVDPASVKVIYLRSPSVDLTERVKAHVTPEGIDMSDVEVPPGTHTLRLDVRDQQGRSSTATIKLVVTPK